MVLGIYVLSFIAAFACMFFFPPGALALVLIGVLGLVVFRAGGAVLGWAERRLSRRCLERGTCPLCEQEVISTAGEASRWECPRCRTKFSAVGSVVLLDEAADENP